MFTEVVPAEVTAKQREAYQRSLFASFDQNHNGKLTQSEFVQVIIGNLFRDFDKDKSGKISHKEFLGYAIDKMQAEKEYPIMDAEAKGFITLKDVYRNKALIQRIGQEFGNLDTKGKGYVTLADLPDLTPED